MPLNNDDIKQLISILQRGLSPAEDIQEEKPKTKTKKTSKSKAVTDTNNKFVALGFDKLHKEDIAIDKMLNKNPPTPRNRHFKVIDVQCRVCGRKESINPSLLYEAPDRYKCNRCSSSPG
jgi:hypothetical protein